MQRKLLLVGKGKTEGHGRGPSGTDPCGTHLGRPPATPASRCSGPEPWGDFQAGRRQSQLCSLHPPRSHAARRT